jgi:mono/diheme cytochrome c family protein
MRALGETDRRRHRTTTASALLVLALLAPCGAQSQTPRAAPPEWENVEGWQVFVDKGCGECHRVRGVGDATAGPDLARLRAAVGLFEVGAAMWNHLPRAAAVMREKGGGRPRLTPIEFSNLAAFLFTIQNYPAPGDAAKGAGLFAVKGCAQCHALGGTGGSVGPALDGLKRSDSPIVLAAAMWNHGPPMAEAMAARSVAYPTLRGTELADLLAHVAAVGRDPAGEPTPVVPGSPARGEKVFAEKGCIGCHPVGSGKGGAAPRLGTRGHHVSAAEFAGLMWNHGARMWAAMKQRGAPIPHLSAQEMADVSAYLYTVYYFDAAAGRAGSGRDLLRRKGCLSCHSIYRKGAGTAPDLAIDNVVATPAGQVAAMWNHGRYMETAARRQAAELPRLTGQEMADITTYLAALGSGPPKRR